MCVSELKKKKKGKIKEETPVVWAQREHMKVKNGVWYIFPSMHRYNQHKQQLHSLVESETEDCGALLMLARIRH